MKIYIWGTGEIAEKYLSYCEIAEECILGFIESKKSKDVYRNKKVFAPEEIVNTEYDYILICIYNKSDEVLGLCKKIELPIDKIIFADNHIGIDAAEVLLYDSINTKQYINKMKFPCLFEKFVEKKDCLNQRYIITRSNGFDLVDRDKIIGSRGFNTREYKYDYFRFRTFELMANEILMKDVPGEVAEVGVFRGIFSRMINYKFCDKNLYLFDTFESFDTEEFKQEFEKGRCDAEFIQDFAETSVESVLNSMPYPQKCVVKKGLFPQTVSGMEDESYAFVSIDVDFENSIVEGLRYFYPRLNSGGAIFIHDYNNRFLEGVKVAIDRYEKEINSRLIRVPLADEGGTLVIVKY